MNDETAIRQLLEKESATWRAGDYAAHAACWHIRPYSRIVVSTPEGKVIDVPPQLMHDPKAEMGDGGASENSNYRMRIDRDQAWVTHDEISMDKDGAKTYSHEFRMLEKIDGAWKLVAQSIHQYK